MRWNRDAGLHTLAAQSLGKLPAPDTLTHPNNTAGCCCTMTEPLPERPNTARYTHRLHEAGGEGGGAGEEMTSNSCSFPPSLPLFLCVFVHLSYLFLSEKIPPTLPFFLSLRLNSAPHGRNTNTPAQSRRLRAREDHTNTQRGKYILISVFVLIHS